MSAFAERVYDSIRDVPEGEVVTYKWVAEQIDCGSCQAIGQALSRNPYKDVPCHRVIRSDGFIGGFFGDKDFTMKKKILEKEGVAFDEKGFLIK